ncbi:hypothetical protein ACFFX0_32695 [Citricoccus parietis]|uniref:Uncharacterized protein n=1 Tax=Citricoccus parietis TaxID=592307 RepID=A0ABV5G9N4_9MICC
MLGGTCQSIAILSRCSTCPDISLSTRMLNCNTTCRVKSTST